jgi:hypothetical protein
MEEVEEEPVVEQNEMQERYHQHQPATTGCFPLDKLWGVTISNGGSSDGQLNE